MLKRENHPPYGDTLIFSNVSISMIVKKKESRIGKKLQHVQASSIFMGEMV
jgi:hypothetical protein